MECTFVDSTVTPDQAVERGHTHIAQLVHRADSFQNANAILLNHFSARYTVYEVQKGIEKYLPEALQQKVPPLLHGFPMGRPSKA